MNFMNCFLVAVGGAVGSLMRYLLTPLCFSLSQRSGLPIGTLAANVGGCFVIGLLASLAQKNPAFPESARLLLIPGVLGGFTTYSAFAWESWALASGATGVSTGLLYFSLTSALAFMALFAGVALSRLIP